MPEEGELVKYSSLIIMVIHERLEKIILSCFKDGEWLRPNDVVSELRLRVATEIATDLSWEVRGILTVLERRNKLIYDEDTASYRKIQ